MFETDGSVKAEMGNRAVAQSPGFKNKKLAANWGANGEALKPTGTQRGS